MLNGDHVSKNWNYAIKMYCRWETDQSERASNEPGECGERYVHLFIILTRNNKNKQHKIRSRFVFFFVN